MEKAAKNNKNNPQATKRRKMAKPAQERKKYGNDVKEEAKDLYLKGVTLDRVAKYLSVPLRTLTNWQTDYKWTEAKDPAGAVADLKRKGYQVAEIATRLDISEKTVRRWLKAAG